MIKKVVTILVIVSAIASVAAGAFIYLSANRKGKVGFPKDFE